MKGEKFLEKGNKIENQRALLEYLEKSDVSCTGR